MKKKYYLIAPFLIASSYMVHAIEFYLPARPSAISISIHLVVILGNGLVSVILFAISRVDFQKLKSKRFSYEK